MQKYTCKSSKCYGICNGSISYKCIGGVSLFQVFGLNVYRRVGNIKGVFNIVWGKN